MSGSFSTSSSLSAYYTDTSAKGEGPHARHTKTGASKYPMQNVVLVDAKVVRSHEDEYQDANSDQRDRYTKQAPQDMSVNAGDVVLSYETQAPFSCDPSESMTQVWGSFAGAPKDVRFKVEGVSNSDVDASNMIRRPVASIIKSGYTERVCNTGPEPFRTLDYIGVRAPVRNNVGFQYGGKSSRILPELFPIRMEIPEFFQPTDDAVKSFQLATMDIDDVDFWLTFNNPQDVNTSIAEATLRFREKYITGDSDLNDTHEFKEAIMTDLDNLKTVTETAAFARGEDSSTTRYDLLVGYACRLSEAVMISSQEMSRGANLQPGQTRLIRSYVFLFQAKLAAFLQLFQINYRRRVCLGQALGPSLTGSHMPVHVGRIF